MKHHLNRSLIYLALTDLIWYLSLAFLFFSSFYVPIIDVLKQAYDAIAENTQTLAATQDPLTSQISLEPHSQLLITYILFFVALAAILGLIADFIKSKIKYNKPFWLKTLLLQIGHIVLSILIFYLYARFAFSIISPWFVIALILAQWAAFIWFLDSFSRKFILLQIGHLALSSVIYFLYTKFAVSIIPFVFIIILILVQWSTLIWFLDPFSRRVIMLQIGQTALFIVMLSISLYLLFIQFAVPIIPMWLMVILIAALWAVFFWFIASCKAKILAKIKFRTPTLWFAYALVGICVILLFGTKILALVGISAKPGIFATVAGLVWLVGWNWLQLHIASFK